MKAYEINGFGIENLSLVVRAEPKPDANEVVVKFHAASLNYRDLMTVKGTYNPKLKRPRVPLSDGAGEIVAVGANVTKWRIGDRVCPTFFQGWHEGAIDFNNSRTTLGGDFDGCLREFGTFDENGLVKIPDNLTFEEAATLPCAAVTAYHALFTSGCLKSEDTVLLQGTGGVSIFALQFASVFGCRTIITSSDNEKLARAKDLGASEIINYKEREDWDKAVLDLTERQGVEQIIEVGGSGTMQKSLNAVKMGGQIAVIGVLASKGEFDIRSILMKSVKMQGIFVGSRQMFERMNQMICQHTHFKPIVDKVFDFEDAQSAFKYMESAAHFGKIVIKIN